MNAKKCPSGGALEVIDLLVPGGEHVLQFLFLCRWCSVILLRHGHHLRIQAVRQDLELGVPGIVLDLHFLVDVVGFGEADHELAGIDVGDVGSKNKEIH